MTRGQMVIDHNARLSCQPNVILMEEIDVSIYLKYLFMAFGADV